MRPPRIIGRFVEKDKGICCECKENHPLNELALVARSDFNEIIFAFDIYCSDCFYDMSDGDESAWREAYQGFDTKVINNE